MYVYNLHTMKREESVSSPLSVVLGNFDGVHAGHAELVRLCTEYAAQHGTVSAVWTFADSFGKISNKPGVRCLTGTEEKLALMAELGVDYAIIENFSDVRDMTPEYFVKKILIERCGAVCAVCGYNFRFGAGGVGNCETLRSLMAPLDCIVVPPVYCSGEAVSSTRVRAVIENGDMESAAQMLSRPFGISLPVVDGKHLGRTIGIPTINQNFPGGHIIPRNGIYAVIVSFDGERYFGVANVGVRPTVAQDDHRVNCETHIIGFDGWLYGKTVRVEFYKRLRDEVRFSDVESLGAQIRRDIESALAYFSDHNILLINSEEK